MSIILTQTCGACPEQYDAHDETGQLVGYLRLRHGEFTVECPDVGGELVFDAGPEGDGDFMPHEREGYLEQAKSAIEGWLKSRSRPVESLVQ